MSDWKTYVRERLPLTGLRPEHEQDVVDDLAGQLDEAYRDAIARGLNDQDATAEAKAHIADWASLARQVTASPRLTSPLLTRIEDRTRDAALDGQRRAGMLAPLLHYLRSATRLRGHRGYFAFATATLAVAVGVNLIVFTVVNALWLRPLPFADADRLVAVLNQPFVRLTAPALKSFEALAGQAMTSDQLEGLRPRIRVDGVPRELETLGVTHQYFGLFGLTVRGRDFTQEDDRIGAEPVAIISDRFWASAFGRRPDVVGTMVSASPFAVRIIGVAPPGFEGAQRGERADLWIPHKLVPRASSFTEPAGDDNTSLPLAVFARLHPGQTVAAATQEFRKGILGGAEVDELRGPAVVPLKDVFGTPESRTIVIREGNALGVVAGLALLVLLGGCATLAALVLVHYERRRREQAVKIALGASRRRLAGELSLELALLALAGTVGAILLAFWGLRALPSLSLPGGVNLGRLDLSIDWRVVFAAIGATALTLVLAAWLPVSRFTRAALAGELVAGPAATASASSQRIRQTLLALHVTATIVVLVAAGLFVRAVIHGFGSAPGFDSARTAFATIQLRLTIPTSVSYDEHRRVMAEQTDRLSEALRALPGIESIAMGQAPISPEAASSMLTPIAIETNGQRQELFLGRMAGDANLLSALGVPLLSGRALTAADATVKPTPAVITASLARLLWPDAEPLGQTMSGGVGRGAVRYQVVGVARDFVFGSLSRPAAGVAVTVRAGGFGIGPQYVIQAKNPAALVEAINTATRGVVPDATLIKVLTGREVVTRDLEQQRLGAWFFSGFGLTALLLGVGGVFGLVAYLAESRRREFAVRLALGATSRNLVRHGLVAALVPVAAGVVAGLAIAAMVARLFTSLLTGLSTVDPITYVAVATTMMVCAALAGLGAAWRLRRMMPTDALRAD